MPVRRRRIALRRRGVVKLTTTQSPRPLAPAHKIHHFNMEGQNGQCISFPTLLKRKNRLLRLDEAAFVLPLEQRQTPLVFLIPLERFRNNINLLKLSVPQTPLNATPLEYTIKNFFMPGAIPMGGTPNLNDRIQCLTKQLETVTKELANLKNELQALSQENAQLKTKTHSGPRSTCAHSKESPGTSQGPSSEENPVIHLLQDGEIIKAIKEAFTYLTSEDNILNSYKYIQKQIKKRMDKLICKQVCDRFSMPFCSFICETVAGYLQVQEPKECPQQLSESQSYIWGFVGALLFFLALL